MKEQFVYNLFMVAILIIFVLLYIYKNMKKPKNKKEYKEKSQYYYTRNRNTKAINLSVEALNKFSYNTEDIVSLKLVIANCYYELKNYSDAVKYYNEAFNLAFSSNKDYYYSECFIYALDSLINLSRFEDAKKLLNKIIFDNENKKNFKKEFKKLIIFGKKNKLL